jgi:hypothetical protein
MLHVIEDKTEAIIRELEEQHQRMGRLCGTWAGWTPRALQGERCDAPAPECAIGSSQDSVAPRMK